MTQPTPSLPSQGLLLVISGPSGVGKTTIAHHIEKALKGKFSVSVTTRPKAPADVEGVDYHFVQAGEFERIRASGDLLESAEVFGHWYGTPRQAAADAMAQGEIVILEIDVQGATQVKNKVPDCFAIFILPPNEQALLERLRARRREDEAVIQQRYARAKDEITQAQATGIYNAFVINDDLVEAARQAENLARKALEARRDSSRA